MNLLTYLSKNRALQQNIQSAQPNNLIAYKFFILFYLYKLEALGEKCSAMNKAELVEAIQNNLGKDATKRAAEDALSAVLTSIAKGVKKDKKVQLIGFGTFEVKKRAARMGRNPKTGESMKIKASKTVGFKASSNLKASL